MSAAREISLPLELRSFLIERGFAAVLLDQVKILCVARLPFGFLPGFDRYTGITLWKRIYLKEAFSLDARGDVELLLHELVHVRQFAEQPVSFPIFYLWHLAMRGYRAHPAEIEARALAARWAEEYCAVKEPHT